MKNRLSLYSHLMFVFVSLYVSIEKQSAGNTAIGWSKIPLRKIISGTVWQTEDLSLRPWHEQDHNEAQANRKTKAIQLN